MRAGTWAIGAWSLPGTASAHGLADHPGGWPGRLIDLGQGVLVVGFVVLVVASLYERYRK